MSRVPDFDAGWGELPGVDDVGEPIRIYGRCHTEPEDRR